MLGKETETNVSVLSEFSCYSFDQVLQPESSLYTVFYYIPRRLEHILTVGLLLLIFALTRTDLLCFCSLNYHHLLIVVGESVSVLEGLKSLFLSNQIRFCLLQH